MAALDVISLEEAKDYLRVDFIHDDATITGIIETAIALVENHTSHMLYVRELKRFVRSGYEIYEYPFEIVSLGGVEEEVEGVPVITSISHKVDHYSLFSKLQFGIYGHTELVLNVGYEVKADIPAPLLRACYKLIVYLYEHRDIQQAIIPADVYLMLQPYRRYATI